MNETTPLDAAHAEMLASEESDAARLRFFERLGDCELFLLLSEEAADDTLSPELFELDAGRYVLAFDREERLAAFAEHGAHYAALSGRILARMLAGQGIGLGLNLDVAPSSVMIPAAALAWLSETLEASPEEQARRIVSVTSPDGLPEPMLAALDAKLALTAGLAAAAYLVGVTYEGGSGGFLLGFVDAPGAAQPALAKAVNEAVTFSGVDGVALDVGFVDTGEPMAARLARHGLRFDLPQPVTPDTTPRPAPGSDPDKPPILR